ncbi:hypothetical protein QJS04_geneDACA019368 [Acorus gramineus]|uniref:DNA-directed DNA polymerase n=1 Tax=Acorus gramineus TaxID=55184 RepID=A0AAV9AR45_ACOGR|nr:hypothetical protein QJS04_geneDACA019368 [Acorus gramineus]
MGGGGLKNAVMFFASKKRKQRSPYSNAKRSDGVLQDGSPDVKGTLDSYLVSSPDAIPLVRRSDGALPSPGHAVKRNLASEITRASQVEREEGNEGLKGVQQVAPPDTMVDAGNVSVGVSDILQNPDVESGDGNRELKKFAADFLSLYCGELPSALTSLSEQTPKSNKRNGSPSLLAANGKICMKKQCVSDHDHAESDAACTCSHQNDPEDLKGSINCGETAVHHLRDPEVFVHRIQLEAGQGSGTTIIRQTELLNKSIDGNTGLRKYSNIPNSGTHVIECCTPGPPPLPTRSISRPHETPKSASRSSMFSPGEEFWNEAIQVAECLHDPANKCLVQVAEQHDIPKDMPEDLILLKSGSSSNQLLKKVSSSLGADDMSSLVRDDCEQVRHLGSNACIGHAHTKSSVVIECSELSPFPVKHIDFSLEEKSLKEDGAHQSSVHNMESVVHRDRGGVLSAQESVNRKRLQSSSILTRCGVQGSKGQNRSLQPITFDTDHNNPPSLPHIIDHDSRLQVDGTKTLMSDRNGTSIMDSSKSLLPQPCHVACEAVQKFKDHRSDYGKVDEIFSPKLDENCSPSSAVPIDDSLKLGSWLPPEICNSYMKKGISKLYPWQVECLQVDGVLDNRNLVYCASTSAGKSFVAEILMLRRVITTGKMALFVLPYVSICAEKAEHLEVLLEPLGKHVRSFYGIQGGGSLPKDTSIAVCTIEKANSLVNRLLEEGRLSEVGVIVIDELHMVGDQTRGYLLELMLTKLRYSAGEGNVESSNSGNSGTSSGRSDALGLQIVGMSATMPNVAAVADWLQAALYQTDFRPVPLEEYIKIGNTILNKKMEVVRKLSKTADLGGKDPDHIVELCNEVVQEGHSVLLFCSSRKACESTARHISKYLKKIAFTSREGVCEYGDVSSVLEALRRCPAGLDPVLEETLPSGVGYHHAGLTVEEREIVETCYRKGLVRVLTATSTLAAGVNLPARRVIFRQPRIGRDLIDGTRYRQMAGRAGRTGIDTKGESILICKSEEVKKIASILNDSCPPLQSCLSEDKNGMTHAILEVMAGGIVQTANDIHRYVRCTLLNSTKPFEDVVKSAQDSLLWLCHRKFLEWNEETRVYSTTPLGRAAFGSSLSPEESLVVLDDLSRAREGFVLASDLHMVYLVTPINVDIEPDWELYYERFMELSALDQEVPVIDVCEAFKVARGMIQALQENAGRFASMVSTFCERLGWQDLEGLVAKFRNRVSFGVRAEIAELTTIPYVKGSRARALYKAGLRTALSIAEASVSELAKALFEYSSWAAQEASSSRHMQLGIAKKIKNGARKIVLDQAEEARVAAFSAYKTLGIQVPQFPQNILSSIVENSSSKDSSRESTIEGSKPCFGHLELKNDVQVAPNMTAEFRNKTSEDSPLAVVDALPKKLDIASGSTEVSLARFTLNNHGHYVTKKVEEDLKNFGKIDRVGWMVNGSLDHEHEPKGILSELGCNSGHTSDKGPVSSGNVPGGFDSFLDQWEETREFYFDVHFTKTSGLNSPIPFEIHGMAVCWEGSTVYYVNLSKELVSSSKKLSETRDSVCGIADDATERAPNFMWNVIKQRWHRIVKIMGQSDVRIVMWNLKVQIQALKYPAISLQRFTGLTFEEKDQSGFELLDNSYILLPPISAHGSIDMCVVTWILWPDEESISTPNLEKVVKKRLSSEAAAAATRDGRWRNQMRRAAHNGCCRRVAQIRALYSVLWKLLVSEDLVGAFVSIENPLVKVLAYMELWGIGVDMEACLRARHVLGKKLRELQNEAYGLAGITFSLYTSADIAFVLYKHLKLPIPEGYNKGKEHPSTDKHCLDLLSLNIDEMTYKQGHWLQTSTATGRLSMEEPNLQCVEREVSFTIHHPMDTSKTGSSSIDKFEINARDFFTPTEDNWLIVTADYSQIELRLMAHFSKDPILIELLSKPDGDVFNMLAAKWIGKPESSIISSERDQTKKLAYGILYGMGAKSLAAQLDCSSDEAQEKINNFKKSFPGVSDWLHEAVLSCYHTGYVQTLKGRKRYLTKIKFGSNKEKAKAQRQAVHDELVLEADPSVVREAASTFWSCQAETLSEVGGTVLVLASLPRMDGLCTVLDHRGVANYLLELGD